MFFSCIFIFLFLPKIFSSSFKKKKKKKKSNKMQFSRYSAKAHFYFYLLGASAAADAAAIFIPFLTSILDAAAVVVGYRDMLFYAMKSLVL